MSHVVTVKIHFKDKNILESSCRKLGYELRTGQHKVQLFSGPVECDASIQIPGWRYPIAIVGDELKFDNYNGSWGKQELLDKLQQEYTKQVTIEEAQNMGLFVEEKTLQDGTIELYLSE
jgi:hypothetical protein